VDPATGTYRANIPSPTGIPSDPALAGYGVQQAEQLGQHLMKVDPPVDLIYSSPFYRCLQTLLPFVQARAARDGKEKVRVHVERGVGEFYGLARFDHPSPAPIEELRRHFEHLEADSDPIIVPSTKGESIPQLHDRLAYCLQHLIHRADNDPSGPKSLLICCHAATMIALGRVLTGRMPEEVSEDDFQCFTCSFSKFDRRTKQAESSSLNSSWNPDTPDQIPNLGWKGGAGIAGGWDCSVNGDCSFLEGGEERGWYVSPTPPAFADSRH
jgi:transcription factor C subunit 7